DPRVYAAGGEPLRMCLQRSPVRREQVPASALERARIEVRRRGEILVVVANKELERGAGPLGEPGAALERRLLFRSGVENDENVCEICGHGSRRSPIAGHFPAPFSPPPIR